MWQLSALRSGGEIACVSGREQHLNVEKNIWAKDFGFME